MVAFRKLFPVLAVGAISVASALAQTTSTALVCQANSGVPPVVRAEGITELTGDLVINCTGGNPNVPITTNIQVFLNTNVTSRFTDPNYDALLMIDEPGATRTDATGATSLVTTPFCQSSACNQAAVANQTFQTGTLANGTAYPAAGQTVYRGTRPTINVSGTTSQQNSVVWNGVTVVPPGSNRIRTIRITNIRANASQIGAASSGLPTQISAFISATPSGTLPIDNPQQIVGYVQTGLSFDTRNCGNSGGRSTGTVFQCQSLNTDRYNTPTSGTLPSNESSSGINQQYIYGLRYRETFATAFKPRMAAGQIQSIPGVVYNSESGFVNTNLTYSPNVGVADTGTRLRALFSNVPSNVRLFVSTANVPNFSSSATAVLVATDANGASPTNTDPNAVAAGIPSVMRINCTAGTVSGNNAIEVPITNGTGVAVWEVTSADQSSLDTLFFHVAYAFVANANAGQPGLGQATVTGTFAPVYSGTAAGQSDFGTPSIPRFTAGAATAQNLFLIAACSTNLLFPFVTNQAGFDTGIAIANTSQDPFSSSNQNAGTCKLNYYGSLPNNAPLTTTSEETTSAVPAGSTLTMVLSSGGGFGLKGNPNMQGYIIAQCNFRFGHGFAFITDGPIGQARVAEGYLAIVLDGVNSVRGNSIGEEQGH